MVSSPLSTTRLSLDELVALNDEIRALVRAGIPLERGMAALSKDLPGSLGRAAREIAERGEQGEPLESAVGAMTRTLPPVYRAVIQAGMRSGRLVEALQSLASASRRLAEVRSEVASVLTYPLLVVLTAWGMLVLFAGFVGPRLLAGMEDFGVPGAAGLRAALRLGDAGWILGIGVPVAIIAGAVLWVWTTRRAMMVQPGWSSALLGWLPWIGRMLRYVRAGVFSEFLAMLLEAEVPLPESLRLAAEAAGDRSVRRGAHRMAEVLEQSGTVSGKAAAQSGLPPMVLWGIGSHRPKGGVTEALRHAADSYRRRARHQADRARVFLPVVMTLAVSGASTLIFALIVFVPWVTLMKKLAEA